MTTTEQRQSFVRYVMGHDPHDIFPHHWASLVNHYNAAYWYASGFRDGKGDLDDGYVPPNQFAHHYAHLHIPLYSRTLRSKGVPDMPDAFRAYDFRAFDGGPCPH